jgi:hypothetical protein
MRGFATGAWRELDSEGRVGGARSRRKSSTSGATPAWARKRLAPKQQLPKDSQKEKRGPGNSFPGLGSSSARRRATTAGVTAHRGQLQAQDAADFVDRPGVGLGGMS